MAIRGKSPWKAPGFTTRLAAAALASLVCHKTSREVFIPFWKRPRNVLPVFFLFFFFPPVFSLQGPDPYRLLGGRWRLHQEQLKSTTATLNAREMKLTACSDAGRCNKHNTPQHNRETLFFFYFLIRFYSSPSARAGFKQDSSPLRGTGSERKAESHKRDLCQQFGCGRSSRRRGGERRAAAEPAGPCPTTLWWEATTRGREVRRWKLVLHHTKPQPQVGCAT